MEEKTIQTNTKGSQTGFHITKWLALALSAATAVFVLMILVPQRTGFGIAVYSLYNSSSMMIIAFLALLVGLLFIKGRRELYAKILVWAVLLLGALFCAKFLSSSVLSALGVATFDEGLQVVAQYLPGICATVSLVALVVQWDNSNKNAANNVSMVATVVAVFMAAFFLIKNTVVDAAAFDLVAWATVLFQIALFASYCMISVFVFALTQNRRIFDKYIFGMTDEEAQIAEDVEDRVEAMVADIEDELVEDAAEDLEKEEEAEKVQKVLDELEEALEEVEEEIGETNEELLGDK